MDIKGDIKTAERSVIRLVKDWTLPLAMGLGTLLYLLFAFTPSLDAAARFFDPIINRFLPFFMFLILFVTFCKVEFRRLRPVGWHFWTGLFQVLFIGVLMAIILVFHLQGDSLILMEAILMCVISPCATAAAVVTQKLGGSLADDHLHLPLQLHHCPVGACLFSDDGEVGEYVLPQCFPAHPARGVPGAHRPHVPCLYREALFPSAASADHLHPRPELLPLGLFAGDGHRCHGEEYRACRYDGRSPFGHCFLRTADVCRTVLRRPFYRSLFWTHAGVGSGFRTEEYRLRHLDGLYLS